MRTRALGRDTADHRGALLVDAAAVKHQPVLLRVLYGTVTVTVMRSGVPGDHFVMYTGQDGGIAARRVTAWLDRPWVWVPSAAGVASRGGHHDDSCPWMPSGPTHAHGEASC